MSPNQTRIAILIWLYERSQITTLPQSETAIRNGLRREGTEVDLPALREGLDYLKDKSYAEWLKPPMGGAREDGAWRLTAAGKDFRESL